MIESTSIAIGSGVGAGLATFVFLVRGMLQKRNGKDTSMDVVKRELHDRVNDEVASINTHFVRKDVCSLTSEHLQKNVDEIKKGVDRLVKHALGE